MVKVDQQRILAARVAGSADLNEVRLFNVDAALDQLPTGPGGLSYDFDANVEVQQVAETNSLIVDGRYRLVVHFAEGSLAGEAHAEVTNKGQDDASEPDTGHEHLAHLYFQLAALYTLPDDDDQLLYPEDELHAFGQTTGLLTLHPYAREFVSDMTGRMGLPSLHLGTIRFQIDGPDQLES